MATGLSAFYQAFVLVAVDRLGLVVAAAQFPEQIIQGEIMVALGVLLPVWWIANCQRIARQRLPVVRHFPTTMLFCGSRRTDRKPKYFKRGANRIY
jgi:hypothetical protein